MPAIGFCDGKKAALYSSLDPKSIIQHLAFYELYSESDEGKKALKDACELMSAGQMAEESFNRLPFLERAVPLLVDLISKRTPLSIEPLHEEALQQIARIAAHLENRRLRGSRIESLEDLLVLPSEDIDLARAVLLSQFNGTDMERIKSYEALIDLMALQVKARLSDNASYEEKIKEINYLIFNELRFRFPPHSLWAKDVDVYTFLPDVLDSRYGVCLGVSILYLSVAQRLGLPLEIITPPGHIYLRLNESLNIETTARGIHLDSENYLGIETRALQKRTLKEVIGLTHVNEASIYLHREEYQKALEAYEKAVLFLPDDPLLKELRGFSFLFAGQRERGEELLQEIKDSLLPHAVSRNRLVADYLAGNTDINGIKALLMEVDETKESILRKKEALEEALRSYPEFRDGILGLAVCWMQLHREKEALPLLEKIHALDDENPTVEYYLAELNASRMNYNRAWLHLKRAEELTAALNHYPRTLKVLRRQLNNIFSECDER